MESRAAAAWVGSQGAVEGKRLGDAVDPGIIFNETLKNLYTIWGRPVHIETVVEKKGQTLFSHGPDGSQQQNL